MRTLSAAALALAAGLFAAPACFAAPQLILSDPHLPLWEIRPLDRQVYVLSLEGQWKAPPERDAEYHVNIEFPDGSVVEHRPTLERMFRRGEIQVLLIQYQYEGRHFEKGQSLHIFVTKRLPPGGPDDQEVISNKLAVAWPFDRDVVRLAPKTRYSAPEPIDAFHPAGEEPVPPPAPKPQPSVEPVPPPKPGPEK